MNVFHKIALASLRQNRARTLVTAVGVALSAALATGVMTFGLSLLSYMAEGAAVKYGGWHIAFPAVDTAFLEQQAQDARIDSLAACGELGYAPLPGARNPDKPYLFLAAFDEDALCALPLTLLSGRLPQNEDEVLVPAHALLNGGLQAAVGDTLTLAPGKRVRSDGQALSQLDGYAPDGERLTHGRERTLTVVGVCLRPSFEPRVSPGYTLITRAAPQAAGTLTAFVSLKNPFSLRGYARDAARPYALNDNVLRFYGLSSDRLFTALLLSVGAAALAIVAVGSVFLIYNAFAISTGERVRQFGVLLSAGAAPRQLTRCVLFEGLCVGLLGIPPGMIAGLAGMGALLSAVAGRFERIAYEGASLTLRVSPLALAGAAALSLGVILFSAWLPARRAAHRSVMACMNPIGAQKTAAPGRRERRAAALPLFRALGFEGALALRNARTSRCRSVVLSLALSVALLLASASFTSDLRRTSQRAGVYTNYDVGVSLDGVDDSTLFALFERLKAVPGVTGGVCQAEAAYTLTARAADLSDASWQGARPDDPDASVPLSLTVQFLDDAAFAGVLAQAGLDAQAYAAEGAPLPAVAVMAVGDGQIHELHDFPPLFAVPSLTAPLAQRTASGVLPARSAALEFAAFENPDSLPVTPPMAAGDAPYYLFAVAPYARLAELAGAGVYGRGLTFTSDAPTLAASQMKELLDAQGVPYALYNVSGMLSDSANILFIAGIFSFAFIALIALIAAANAYNTVSSGIRLRRRELATLRAVGMGDRSLSRMLLIESALVAARALLLGLCAGLLAALLLHALLVWGEAESLPFSLPLASVCPGVALVLLSVLLAMNAAARRAQRENILDALRDETA